MEPKVGVGVVGFGAEVECKECVDECVDERRWWWCEMVLSWLCSAPGRSSDRASRAARVSRRCGSSVCRSWAASAQTDSRSAQACSRETPRASIVETWAWRAAVGVGSGDRGEDQISVVCL